VQQQQVQAQHRRRKLPLAHTLLQVLPSQFSARLVHIQVLLSSTHAHHVMLENLVLHEACWQVLLARLAYIVLLRMASELFIQGHAWLVPTNHRLLLQHQEPVWLAQLGKSAQMKVWLPLAPLPVQPATSVGGEPLRLVQPEASEPLPPLRLALLLAPAGLMISVSVHQVTTVLLAPLVLPLVLLVRFSLQRAPPLALLASHVLLAPTAVRQA
jgi:hypothetical protein